MDEKALIDVDYNDDPWEVDKSPESVVLKVEAAKHGPESEDDAEDAG